MKIHLKSFSLSMLCALLSLPYVASASDEFPEVPMQVQNVQVTAGNGQIDLSWNSATDPDGVVVGYKVYYGNTSVQSEEDLYDDEVEVGNVTNYTLKGLTNGSLYYVALTAIDDEGLESDNYSVEVSATPEDVLAKLPKIIGVEQLADSQVELTFSKPIILQSGKTSIVVSEKESGKSLEIQQAETSSNTVILTLVNPFSAGVAYGIVGTSAIQDEDGNAVTEGVMDSIEFVGQDYSVPEILPEEEILENPAGGMEDVMQDLLPLEELEEGSVSFSAPEASASETDASPLDASDLRVDSSELKNEGIIVLKWKKALDIEQDIVDQVLYTRQGMGDWDGGYSLGADISELELEVDMDESYAVRLVTVDQIGQESEGIETTFSTHLTKSGPGSIGTVVALGVAFFLGLLIIGRRKAY